MTPAPGDAILGLGNRLLRVLPPRAATQAWRVLQASHLALYRATSGRVGGSFGGVSVLLLHHVGRRTGRARVSPLLYVEDGGALGVIASKGGHPSNPAWFHNLMAAPDTEVELPRQPRRPVHARVAEGEERERIWARATSVWPDYDRYQERTGRRIPVVVLDPRQAR
jgi:deazaflavin-dependent oxidoreductase (nitroreductase family)